MAIVLFRKGVREPTDGDKENGRVLKFPRRGEAVEDELFRLITVRLEMERRFELNPDDLLEEFIQKNPRDWSLERLQSFLKLALARTEGLEWSLA